jgi:uncharacterized membrane protein
MNYWPLLGVLIIVIGFMKRWNPVLALQHGANPAPLAALGMLTGYCGALMTPMAANYNIVPAALLELSDKNAVIRAQVMTALPLIACNIVLMYWLIFL